MYHRQPQLRVADPLISIPGIERYQRRGAVEGLPMSPTGGPTVPAYEPRSPDRRWPAAGTPAQVTGREARAVNRPASATATCDCWPPRMVNRVAGTRGPAVGGRHRDCGIAFPRVAHWCLMRGLS